MKRARVLVGVAVLAGTLGLSASPSFAVSGPCTRLANGLARLQQAESTPLLSASQIAAIKAAEAQLTALQTALKCI
jgi:hypothetical protein